MRREPGKECPVRRDEREFVLRQLAAASRHPPESPAAQRAVVLWQRYLDRYCYACDEQMLAIWAKAHALVPDPVLERFCPGLSGFLVMAVEAYLQRKHP